MDLTCAHCHKTFQRKSTGRPPKFCGDPCRQAEHRAEKERKRLAVAMPIETASELRRYAQNLEWFIQRRSAWLSEESKALLDQARWLMIEAAEQTSPSTLEV